MPNESSMMPADSHGAVELGAAASAPVSGQEMGSPEAQVGLNVPLVVQVNEENFQDLMANSATVPVVIVMYSSSQLESKPFVASMEDLARDYAGRFQLATGDVDASPQIAQAFQVQGVPAVVALMNQRPLPLFQGIASKDQVRPIIDQVLDAGAQMGINGRIAVSEEDTAAPIPPAHEAPLAAEEAGQLDEAIALWEKVLDLNPKDEAAKAHLARVRVAARSASADASDPAARADALFTSGDHEGAFDLLLKIIASADDMEAKDAARLRLLDLFRVAGNTPDVMKARMVLSTLVLV